MNPWDLVPWAAAIGVSLLILALPLGITLFVIVGLTSQTTTVVRRSSKVDL